MDMALRAYDTDTWEHKITREKFHPIKTNLDLFSGDRVVLKKDEVDYVIEVSSYTFKSDYVRIYNGGREHKRSFLL